MAETTNLEVPEHMQIDAPPPEEVETPAEGKEKQPDPRADIMARIVEKRQAQVAKELEQTEPAETQEAAPEPAGLASPPVPAAGTEAAPPQEPVSAPAPITKIPLVVDGQKLEVTPEELVQLAQKGLSANQRWEEAARMRREAQELLSKPPTPQAPPQQPAADEIVPETLARDVARRLNYGSEEEQIKAIRDLVSGVQANSQGRTQGPTQQDLVNTAVTNALAAVDFRSTLAALGQEFPKVFADTDLSETAGRRVFRAKQEQSLRMQQGLPVEMKSDYELMRDACKFIQDRYILPLGTPPASPTGQTKPAQAAPSVSSMEEKEARKRAAPKPPAAANRVASPPPEKPEPTPKDVVAWMRQKRHQPAF